MKNKTIRLLALTSILLIGCALRTLDLRGNNVSQVDLKIIREKLTAATILTD